jgi:hypothetical protein
MVVTVALALLAGLVGGAVGAAVGARRALGLAGLAVVVGEVLAVTLSEDAALLETFESVPAPVDATALTAAVGFGPLLGPHVAFAGGAAAAAYAGRKQTIDTAFRYHQAKQIGAPLYDSPRALVVGAAFGLLGVLVAGLAAGLGAPLDPVALAVVVSALLHRLAFGYPVLGRFREAGGLFDVSPFEEGAYWGDGDHETAQGIGGRHVVEPWQPEYDEWLVVLGIGAGVGLLAGVVALATDSAVVAFGLAAAALLATPYVSRPVPATYHVALPAGIAAVATDADPLVGLVAAGALGLVAALVGELAGRLLYAHGDTHLDPGFVAMLLTSLVVGALVAAGVFDASAVPYPTL